MKPMITESDIQSIVEKSDEIMNIINKPTEIRLINESDNKVFKIEGKKPIFAKLGLTGWGKVEFQTLIILKEKKYNVPMPITYLPVQDVLNEKSDYGNFKREVGILFYFPLEGQVLEQHLTKINIRNALNFLKKLHEDKSLINEGNINYQDVEVKRGLKYIQKLFKGELAERLQSIMIKYQDIKIDSCFIHGGPRLEHFIFKNNQMGMIDFVNFTPVQFRCYFLAVLVGLEALACGKATIATKTGFSEIITNDINGLLINPKNPKQLKSAIIRLMKKR